MAGFNKVILMGNLTRDPELRYTPSGKAVAEISVAVNTGAKGKEDTVFVNVTVWEKQAENCSEYLRKGSSVLVDGRLKMDEWNDKETGQKRTKLGVVAFAVQFIGKPGGAKKEEAPVGNDDYPVNTHVPEVDTDDVPF